MQFRLFVLWLSCLEGYQPGLGPQQYLCSKSHIADWSWGEQCRPLRWSHLGTGLQRTPSLPQGSPPHHCCQPGPADWWPTPRMHLQPTDLSLSPCSTQPLLAWGRERGEHRGSAVRCAWLNWLWQGCPAARSSGRKATALEKETERRGLMGLDYPTLASAFPVYQIFTCHMYTIY